MERRETLGSALIPLLTAGPYGLLFKALVADLIAEDARFNHWFAVEGKATLGHDKLLEILTVGEDAAEKCLREIARFAGKQDVDALSSVMKETLEVFKKRPAV